MRLRRYVPVALAVCAASPAPGFALPSGGSVKFVRIPSGFDATARLSSTTTHGAQTGTRALPVAYRTAGASRNSACAGSWNAIAKEG